MKRENSALGIDAFNRILQAGAIYNVAVARNNEADNIRQLRFGHSFGNTESFIDIRQGQGNQVIHIGLAKLLNLPLMELFGFLS